jgi:DNA modification methylase
MTVTILIGDVRERLRAMSDESVHCVVTSPPYWGLRDYDVAGQIGMEPTLAEHLAVMVEVFRDVRRVLRRDGTCWLNYGDCYASTPNGRLAADIKARGGDNRTFRDKPFSTIGGVLKAKDLCMIPNRLAIALQEDGWWVRSEIVWHKPNPMPESVHDRPATSHEKVFLLTRAERYFYDAVAVRRGAASDVLHAVTPSNPPRATDKQRGHSRRHAGFNDRWDLMTGAEQRANGRNLRNVWAIATRPFQDAHFATFPPALVEPCIMAGTSERGVCRHCAAPWRRQVNKTFQPQDPISKSNQRSADTHDASSRWAGSARGSVRVDLVGWVQGCACPPHDPVPAIVLDPFGGAGTTALVADRLGRDAILIELNTKYAAMADRRIRDGLGEIVSDAPAERAGEGLPLFAGVVA